MEELALILAIVFLLLFCSAIAKSLFLAGVNSGTPFCFSPHSPQHREGSGRGSRGCVSADPGVGNGAASAGVVAVQAHAACGPGMAAVLHKDVAGSQAIGEDHRRVT